MSAEVAVAWRSTSSDPIEIFACWHFRDGLLCQISVNKTAVSKVGVSKVTVIIAS